MCMMSDQCLVANATVRKEKDDDHVCSGYTSTVQLTPRALSLDIYKGVKR